MDKIEMIVLVVDKNKKLVAHKRVMEVSKNVSNPKLFGSALLDLIYNPEFVELKIKKQGDDLNANK